MTRIPNLILLIGLALVALRLPGPAWAGTTQGQVDYATAQVIAFEEGRGGVYEAVGWGTGTIVDPSGLIVTAFHVVGDVQTRRLLNPEGVVGISLVERTGQAAVPAYLGRVLTYNLALDLALVEIDSTLSGQRLPAYTFFPTVSLPGLRDRVPAPGADVRAYGFATGFDKPAVTVRGKLHRIATVAGFGGKPMVISTTASYAPGLTGGPVLDANGVLAGIALGMNGRGTGAQGVVRPWEEVRVWATGQISPTQAAQPVVVAGQIVDHATGRGIPGALFMVLNPNVATEDFLANPSQDDVAALGTADRDGRFITDPPIDYEVGYNMVVYAENYRVTYTAGPVVLDEATCPERPRCDFGTIELDLVR